MRWLRLISCLLLARFKSKLPTQDTSIVHFRVWLTDIDVSIMNHAAMMTVFETGRIDYLVRTGFMKLARQKGWYFPNGGISVQFLKPLKLFQKAEVSTRVFHVTEFDFYTEQKIIREGKVVAICIAKTRIKKGRENIPAAEIIALLNVGTAPKEAPEIIALYENYQAMFKEKLND